MNNFQKPFYLISNENYERNNAPGPMRGKGKGQGGFNPQSGGFNGGNRGWNGGGDNRYGNAYGDYMGGYGPEGGFGSNCGYGQESGYFQNFGPNQNSNACEMFGQSGQHPAVNYLLKCGMARTIVYRLPHHVLEMISPQYCNICDMHLESYSASCSHYGSKLHLKNQCNLAPNSEPPFKEPPMKSRDLYCELCDVEITSKTHAESHYAGRSHRAIVLERKPPKNENLLFHDMRNRVNQLIRREKKFLKPDETLLTQKVTEPEPKPVPPELFCNICNISVTCSEQMTVHLNGKKHLAKEKYHILQQMRGPKPAKQRPKISFVQAGNGDQQGEASVDNSGDGDGVNSGGGDSVSGGGTGQETDAGDNWEQSWEH